jgi:hypothetical protein
VLNRGRIVVEDGALAAPRGSGAFVPCALFAAAKPAGAPVPEFAYSAGQRTALGYGAHSRIARPGAGVVGQLPGKQILRARFW